MKGKILDLIWYILPLIPVAYAIIYVFAKVWVRQVGISAKAKRFAPFTISSWQNTSPGLHHYCTTRDGRGKITVYIDGEKVEEAGK